MSTRASPARSSTTRASTDLRGSAAWRGRRIRASPADEIVLEIGPASNAIDRLLSSPRMRELLRTKHGVVAIDEEERVLYRARNAEPFGSLVELAAESDEIVRLLDQIDRPRFVQLIDARLAPPRNDPAFETTIERYQTAFYRGFAATAILVRSAVGKLHVRRMLGESGAQAGVFDDEMEAMRYLAEARSLEMGGASEQRTESRSSRPPVRRTPRPT
jgi:hypothetical protein